MLRLLILIGSLSVTFVFTVPWGSYPKSPFSSIEVTP